MEKLSPEDISRAREHRQKSSWHAWSDEKVAAYSAAENERLAGELNLLTMTLDLVATDNVFVQAAEDKHWAFWVNVNDMFYPASDGEGIDLSEIPAVWKAWKEKGWPGVVLWVQEKRGGMKLRKSREETILTIGKLRERAEAAEAKCDRLKGALERIQEFATTEAQSSRDLDAGDAAEWDKVAKMAALRPEGE